LGKKTNKLLLIGAALVAVKFLQGKDLFPTASGATSGIQDFIGTIQGALNPEPGTVASTPGGATGADTNPQTNPDTSSGIITNDEFLPGGTSGAGGTNPKVFENETGPFNFMGFRIDIPLTSIQIPTSNSKGAFTLRGANIRKSIAVGRITGVSEQGFTTNQGLLLNPVTTLRGRNILVSAASALKLQQRGIV